MNLADVGALYGAYKSKPVSRVIHANDVMYRSGPEWYYRVGESAINCIYSALTMTKGEKVSRVLDLPCGHGRVARHFPIAFPGAELFFCEIDREGVDFCASEFDGTGIYSVPDLTKVELPRDLDVIWVGSLFTHISRGKTFDWLSFLSERLAPNGIIVATFHGYFTAYNPPAGSRVDLVKLKREFDSTGYGFASYAPDDPVQLEQYGFSVSKPSTILDMADAIPGTRVAYYGERAWANNHDVLALCRDDRMTRFAEANHSPIPAA